MNIFVDTNVLLDVLAERRPFYADSARVWTLAETGRATGFISALSVPNLFYILAREAGRRRARAIVGMLRDVFTLAALDEQIINQAADADMRDFEDAIQFFSALRVGARVLVTRNAKDFPAGELPVQTPAELLATHFAE